MAFGPELNEKITTSVAPAQIKELLVGLIGEVESLLARLSKDEGSRTRYLAERLVAEVSDPGVGMYLWEIALDIIAKGARTQGEAGQQVLYFLWRFMVAGPFHGRGYGRQAIQRLIEHVRTRPGATELLLSCGEGEGSPEGFYAKQGFTRTGKKEGDEVVMRIKL